MREGRRGGTRPGDPPEEESVRPNMKKMTRVKFTPLHCLNRDGSRPEIGREGLGSHADLSGGEEEKPGGSRPQSKTRKAGIERLWTRSKGAERAAGIAV